MQCLSLHTICVCGHALWYAQSLCAYTVESYSKCKHSGITLSIAYIAMCAHSGVVTMYVHKMLYAYSLCIYSVAGL